MRMLVLSSCDTITLIINFTIAVICCIKRRRTSHEKNITIGMDLGEKNLVCVQGAKRSGNFDCQLNTAICKTIFFLKTDN